MTCFHVTARVQTSGRAVVRLMMMCFVLPALSTSSMDDDVSCRLFPRILEAGVTPQREPLCGGFIFDVFRSPHETPGNTRRNDRPSRITYAKYFDVPVTL